MTESQTALARRLVAAPGWRWLPGMRVADTKFARVVAVRDSGPCGAEEGATCDDNAAVWLDEGATPMLPDLSDPLTALGLLALVRERWGMAHLAAVRKDGAWMLWAGGLPDALYLLRAPTELEVLILALEVAP
jgi:hypothetical protein